MQNHGEPCHGWIEQFIAFRKLTDFGRQWIFIRMFQHNLIQELIFI